MAQRISRAKRQITTTSIPFGMPPSNDPSRLPVVLHVLYLIFNEGYAASSGDQLQRTDLANEAIRLTRLVHAERPDDAEIAGLLALMLLNDARRAARTGPHGELVPLADQDRGRWNRRAIDEGIALITAALPHGPIGPYQLQAAIAAVHAEAATDADTDWPQILALYDLLERVVPNPVVSLNRVVAVAMVDGPRAGLDALDALEAGGTIADSHRRSSTRGHLLERMGDAAAARAAFLDAARRTASLPERRYLEGRARRLEGG